MPERQGRYTEAERQQFAANRRQRAAGAKYGTSYAEQGLTGEKESGKAYLAAQELKKKYGAFADPTWDYNVVNGVLMRRPKASQTGRIAAQGGTAQWEVAPDYAQKAFNNPDRQQFFRQNPEAGFDAWQHQQYLNRLQTDPETGWKINQAGELYNPQNRILTGGPAEYAGPRTGGQPRGGAPFPGGPGQPLGYPGGYGGYIPGYSMPFGTPQYGMGGNLGQLGSQGWGAYAPPMSFNAPSYVTMQQQGGSTFGSYPPAQPYSNPFQAYQPAYASGYR